MDAFRRLRNPLWPLAALALTGMWLIGAATPAAALGSLSKAKELRKNGDCLGAEKEVEQYLKLNPNDPDAHILLGWCQYERDNKIGAEKSFKKALELNPNHPDAPTIKVMIKTIEDSFAHPEKPPLPLKTLIGGDEKKTEQAAPEANTGGGIVGSPGTGTSPGPTPGANRPTGKGQLGKSLTDVGNESSGSSNATALIVIAALGVIAIVGVVIFLVMRNRESDELVI